jgi:DNA-directed RNA polymerase subunit M/transcription elongation factor TFIIS
MGRWLERKPNWLKNESYTGSADLKRKNAGRPENTDGDYAVKFIPLRCPRCGSKKIRWYVSHPPIRYHRCKECGHNFKSIEEQG